MRKKIVNSNDRREKNIWYIFWNMINLLKCFLFLKNYNSLSIFHIFNNGQKWNYVTLLTSRTTLWNVESKFDICIMLQPQNIICYRIEHRFKLVERFARLYWWKYEWILNVILVREERNMWMCDLLIITDEPQLVSVSPISRWKFLSIPNILVYLFSRERHSFFIRNRRVIKMTSPNLTKLQVKWKKNCRNNVRVI